MWIGTHLNSNSLNLLPKISKFKPKSVARLPSISRRRLVLLVAWCAQESGKTGFCDACQSSCQPTELRRRHTSEQSSRVRRAGGYTSCRFWNHFIHCLYLLVNKSLGRNVVGSLHSLKREQRRSRNSFLIKYFGFIWLFF